MVARVETPEPDASRSRQGLEIGVSQLGPSAV
jgi:hypothetical protein